MRILMNVNEQISATMMEKHFQASNLEAEVTAAPGNMMLEMLGAFTFDLFAFYAEDVDNATLTAFLKSTGDIPKILFIKKQNLALLSEALEDMLDECFTLPLDSNDVMIRLRRMLRATEQRKAEMPLQPQQPVVTQEQPQAAPYQPPVAQEPIQARPYQAHTEEEPTIAPIQTTYTYDPESFRQEPAQQTDFIPEPTVVPPVTTRETRQLYEPETTDGTFDTGPVSRPDSPPLHTKDSAAQSKKTGKKSLAMRIASGLGKSLFYILVFVVAVLAVFMVKNKISGGTPSVLGYQLYGVLSGSMNGKQKSSFNTGSLVFVKEKPVQKIEVGDIITFRGLSIDAPMTTHRVVAIKNEGGLSFVTRGDANNVNDPKPISAEKVVGTVRGHVPFIGYLTGFAETKTGLIFLVFVPGSIIIAYELVNIYRTLVTQRKKREDE